MPATDTASALNRSAVSRYLQLADLFRQRITDGDWRVGQQIPTITDLACDCGVAVLTVRRALDILETEHLIERFRARGTFVRQRPARDAWCAVSTDFTGLLIARYSSRIEVLEDSPATGRRCAGARNRRGRAGIDRHRRRSGDGQ